MENTFDYLSLEVFPATSAELNGWNKSRMFFFKIGPVENGSIIKAGKILDFPCCDIFLFVNSMLFRVEKNVQLLFNSI